MTQFYFETTDCSRFTCSDIASDAIFTEGFLEWAKDYDIRFCSKDLANTRIIEIPIGQLSYHDFLITHIPSDSILIPDESTAVLFKLTWL